MGPGRSRTALRLAAGRRSADRGIGRRPPSGGGPSARDRFREVDRYRAEREWQRYEGTAQRDLYRELRERFLDRHSGPARWAADLGSGPGRFTGRLGGPGTRRVAVDLSLEMLALLEARERRPEVRATLDRVRADAARSPFAPGSFEAVALLGNALGFAGAESERLWSAALSLVHPGGTLTLEIAPGPGERSRYLVRLPPTSVARLLRAPLVAVRPRVEREGFAPEPERRAGPREFRRFSPDEVTRRLVSAGWEVREVTAVAPALGTDAARLEAVRPDAKAWAHLLELEEQLGRTPARWARAAAVLIAARRPLSNGQD